MYKLIIENEYIKVVFNDIVIFKVKNTEKNKKNIKELLRGALYE